MQEIFLIWYVSFFQKAVPVKKWTDFFVNVERCWMLNAERSLPFLNAERLNGIFFLNGNKPGF